ncbi:MAG: hypothetical protein RLZZ230_315 [Candidatus Parcubacteria bacterium]|jgi:uncharacterized membrane protein
METNNQHNFDQYEKEEVTMFRMNIETFLYMLISLLCSVTFITSLFGLTSSGFPLLFFTLGVGLMYYGYLCEAPQSE